MGKVVAIRGAISVKNNTREEILASSQELLGEMVRRNKIAVEDIISIIFTATQDLDAAFPAEAARQMGWNETALLDAAEIAVPGSMPQVVRVLMHVGVAQEDFKPVHTFLGNAKKLRLDLSSGE
mgnify:CR=1 FL=1